MITIFRYFDNVLICLKMSLVFCYCRNDNTKCNFKKIKNRKQSIDAYYISTSQWTTFLPGVYFWYYLLTFTLREQSLKFVRVCFYHVITERCLPALIVYCRKFKYTCYIALVYTLKLSYKKCLECPLNKEYFKSSKKFPVSKNTWRWAMHFCQNSPFFAFLRGWWS